MKTMIPYYQHWTPAGEYCWFEVHGKYIFKKKLTRTGTSFEIWEYEHLLVCTTNEWDFVTAAQPIVTRYITDSEELSPAIAA